MLINDIWPVNNRELWEERTVLVHSDNKGWCIVPPGFVLRNIYWFVKENNEVAMEDFFRSFDYLW